ncbi:hypothetical protein KFK09_000649 [Dendrobium nobile]|uniref:Uncharacterized protein n=1 Tax=Dendrobium nobile TaxID=94219 RepID=A0A8T3CDN9_DENNO|nr:hypothetical protein KFK09_000649 [Dendrobium nobile]
MKLPLVLFQELGEGMMVVVLLKFFKKKIKRSLRNLFFWSKNKLKELSDLKSKLQADIVLLQEEGSIADGDLNPEKLLLLRKFGHELNVTLARLASWWRQHFKTLWIEDDDQNSQFFHSYVSARRNGNQINQINLPNGDLENDPEGIQSEFLKYFQNKWRTCSCSLQNWPSFANSQLNDDMKKMLKAYFTREELCNT